MSTRWHGDDIEISIAIHIAHRDLDALDGVSFPADHTGVTPGSYGIAPTGFRLPDSTRLGAVTLRIADHFKKADV